MIIYYSEDAETYVQLTDPIIRQPVITKTLDNKGSCVFTILTQYESGTTFSDWSDRNRIGIKVFDDSNNLLFWGRLLKKEYYINSLTLYCDGFLGMLEELIIDEEVGKELKGIVWAGRVKTTPSSSTNTIALEEQNSDGDWVDADIDGLSLSLTYETFGIVIEQDADNDNETWQVASSSDIVINLGSESSDSDGYTGTLTRNDDLEFKVDASSGDSNIDFILSGANIATTEDIEEIVLNFKMKQYPIIALSTLEFIISLYNYNTSSYDLLRRFYLPLAFDYQYIDTEINLNNLNVDNLEYYLNTVSSNYTEMKIKIQTTGSNKVYFDEIKANIYYTDSRAFQGASGVITSYSGNTVTSTEVDFYDRGVRAGDKAFILRSTGDLLRGVLDGTSATDNKCYQLH